MRISDWSSDVCSSDLIGFHVDPGQALAGFGIDALVEALRGLIGEIKVQLGAALIITQPAAKQLVALRQTVRGRVLVDDDVVEAETLDVANRMHREGLKRLGEWKRVVMGMRVYGRLEPGGECV